MAALSRLETLTADDGLSSFVFQRQAQKIKIISSIGGFGPCPEPDEETEI